MTKTAPEPLTRLVLFMVVLSVAGSIIAGVHYYAVDLPQQQSLLAPTNTDDCWADCISQYDACLTTCRGSGSYTVCAASCYAASQHCRTRCDG